MSKEVGAGGRFDIFLDSELILPYPTQASFLTTWKDVKVEKKIKKKHHNFKDNIDCILACVFDPYNYFLATAYSW